jgi:hypothetical protein
VNLIFSERVAERYRVGGGDVVGTHDKSALVGLFFFVYYLIVEDHADNSRKYRVDYAVRASASSFLLLFFFVFSHLLRLRPFL